MKKIILSAVAVLVLAGSSAPAATLNAIQIAGKDKPKTAEPAPESQGIPPYCPYNDPNGCGILD